MMPWARPILFVAGCALLNCVFGPPALAWGGDWKIVPGVRAGKITAATTVDDLREMYGGENIALRDVYKTNGTPEPGAVLFPGEPAKTIEILWQTGERPLTVIVKNTGTLWKTDQGITIGTTLKEIEKRNRKPFTLLGFGWDYAGTVTDMNGGKLKEIDDRALSLRLYPADGRFTTVVKGKKEFSSGDPDMQELNPCVCEMVIELREK